MISIRPIGQGKFAKSMILSLSILAIVVLAPIAPVVHGQSVVTSIPVDYKPLGIGVNVLTNEIYVGTTVNFAGNLDVIDGSTNAIIARIPTGDGTSTFKVAVNPITNTVYATNSLGSSVFVIDGRSHTLSTTIPICDPGSPSNLAVDWRRNTVYVSCSYPAALAVIDGRTNTVAATISLSAYIGNARPVAVNIRTDQIYVGDGSGSNVVAIDGKTNSVTASIPVSVSDFHLGIDVNPRTNMIYVSNDLAYGPTGWPDGSVSVINGSSNTVIATVPVGPLPFGVGVDSRTNEVFVANSGTGTSNTGSVSVIDGETNAVVATVAAPAQPIDIGVNPRTGLIYVAEYYICKSSSCSSDPNANSVLVISGGSSDQEED